MKITASLFFLLLLVTTFASAQEPDVAVQLALNTLEQPAVIKMLLPKYPDAAKKLGLGGRVNVPVTVDIDGTIISVGGADGPYPVCQSVTDPNVTALRNVASEAARKVKFKPTGVKLTGSISYSFLASGAKVAGLQAVRIGAVTDQTGSAAIVLEPGMTPPAGAPGVLNGQATKLAKPTYPAAARAVRAGGSVNAQVLIDKDGSVYSAEAISGHPLLRRSAEIAACDSRFSPTLLAGEPVKVSGIITYNFVP